MYRDYYILKVYSEKMWKKSWTQSLAHFPKINIGGNRCQLIVDC